jgi:hypothetical protein
MSPLLAHHAGEQSLATLILLGGGSLSVVVAIGRAHLAAARAKLTRKQPGSRHRRWRSLPNGQT